MHASSGGLQPASLMPADSLGGPKRNAFAWRLVLCNPFR